ncbi:MAG TPA: transglutaminase family protein [Opitutus sp.]|nr:transglutaminase family protein [Opitutus sp.]
MFLRIIHVTRYDYSGPVTFAPHAIYLRPRESPRQRLHRFELSLSLPARRIATADAEGNALEWAYFDVGPSATTLEFRAESLVETLDANPFDFFLKPSALGFPFAYDAAERSVLAPCLELPRGSEPAQLHSWVGTHLPTAPVNTVSYLSALNSAVKAALRYTVREEAGIQTPSDTFASVCGSCRDYSVFFIALCRSLGLAARFVSGYLYEPPPPGSTAALSPALHAWAEVYLPGAGWRGLDPTHGMFCDDRWVPLAHSAIAENVNPVQGTFYGAGVTSRMESRLTIDRA